MLNNNYYVFEHVNKFLSLYRALLNLYIVHSSTNALFIKLGKV